MTETEGDSKMNALLAETGEPVAPAAPQFDQANPMHLKEFVNVHELKKDVQFDVMNLDKAVMEHAGLFVHYADLARQARRQFERMKAAFEILESRLYAIHRKQQVEEKGKATDASVEAAVKGDLRRYRAQQLMIDARAVYDLANDSREAFVQRQSMIVQTSVDRRKEREGTLRVMDGTSTRAGLMAAGAAARESAQAIVDGAS